MISSQRRPGTTDTGEVGQVVRQERIFGRMERVVSLPSEVTADCATASFTNGVLEIRLRKTMAERGERIPIE